MTDFCYCTYFRYYFSNCYYKPNFLCSI